MGSVFRFGSGMGGSGQLDRANSQTGLGLRENVLLRILYSP